MTLVLLNESQSLNKKIIILDEEEITYAILILKTH